MTTLAAAPAGARSRDALVTGEAVLLDLRPASFAIRMLSGAIDGAVQVVLLIAGSVSVAWTASRTDLDPGLTAAMLLVAAVIAYIGYPLLCETLGRGRSLGRLVVGTRAVRGDGGPLHVRQSLLRAVCAMLEIWATAGALALTCSVIDRRSRRLGDMMAGTLVVQERMHDVVPDPLPVPDALAPWAREADLGRLPVALVQDIRAFLPRAERIHPESRRALARDLVQRTLPHVAPAPPPGTDQEAFLAAVVGERARRDEARLRAQDERRRAIAAEVRSSPFTREGEPAPR